MARLQTVFFVYTISTDVCYTYILKGLPEGSPQLQPELHQEPEPFFDRFTW